MREKRNKVICVRCPKGCIIIIKYKDDGTYDITGYTCPLGKKYAQEELENPRRVVTTTVKIIGARYPRLPVRTEKPVPKNKIFDVIKALKDVVVEAPVKRGQVILENVADTGVNVISERTMEKIILR